MSPSDLQQQLQQAVGSAYHIERELSGAGMSRVFVATEAELERQVVIKVLPPTIAAELNAERFRREIQLAARLSHPHIVPLFSATSRGSLLYYTMPFIDGENVRERLRRTGELPVQDATRIMRDVAEALSYAHSRGVIHRDIKPENIILSGTHALVLDFGVSKAVASAVEDRREEESRITAPAVAIGTPAYMPPEQAVADPHIDHRADIYALGIVGYELLTGKSPFGGMAPPQTLAAQLHNRPEPLSSFGREIPPGLSAIIMRCLAKNPADRFQTADELHVALEPYSVTSGAHTPTGTEAAAVRWPRRPIAIVAGVVAVAAATLIAATVALNRSPETVVVGATRQITSAPGMEFHPSVSPDGKVVAYVTGAIGRTRLYVRQVAGGRAIPLTDTALSPLWPQWTRDGSEVLFSAGTRIMRVPAFGGAATPIPALDGLTQCSLSYARDRLACARGDGGGLVAIGRNGEDRKDLTDAGGGGVFAPAWSSDGRAIAFARGNGGFLSGTDIGNIAPSSIWVMNADGGTPTRISDATHLNTSPVWTADGDLLFISNLGGARDIYLQRINDDLTPRGEPTRITTGLNPHTISMSGDGKVLAYSAFTTTSNVWTTTAAGSPTANANAAKPITTGNQTVEYGSVSPDGRWLVYDSNVSGNQEIFKLPLGGGDPEQLTKNGFDDFQPSWSADGSQIVFYSLQNGTRDIFAMNADGTNVQPVYEGPGEQRLPAWRGTDEILYMVFPDSVFSVRKAGTTWGRPHLAASGGISPWMYSPDGKSRVKIEKDGPYVSAADGSNARPIVLQNKQLLSSIAGAGPWSSDSRHFYAAVREPDGTSSIWQIPVNGDEERQLIHFVDPSRQLYRSTFHVFGNAFYFTIGDRQSDVWTMELTRRR